MLFKKSNKNVKAPSILKIMMEGRAIWELGSYYVSKPLLNRLPKGDGHPVLVLPGLGASDASTTPLRKFLVSRGYAAYDWGLGRNFGLRDGILEGMQDRLEEIYKKHGRKVSLVGWSLGGLFARELAKMHPEKVRIVMSLGSPHSGDPKATNAWRFYEFVAGHSIEEPPIETLLHKAPPVPTTSIYTKTDGVVAWQNCYQSKPINPEKVKQTENICVQGSHCGLGVNPSVLYIIADRLAQREGKWRPFANVGSRKAFFETPGWGLDETFATNATA
jgi:pimeloyl-ACP methyl ester carboxylesterase